MPDEQLVAGDAVENQIAVGPGDLYVDIRIVGVGRYAAEIPKPGDCRFDGRTDRGSGRRIIGCDACKDSIALGACGRRVPNSHAP